MMPLYPTMAIRMPEYIPAALLASSPWPNYVFLSDEICIGSGDDFDDG